MGIREGHLPQGRRTRELGDRDGEGLGAQCRAAAGRAPQRVRQRRLQLRARGREGGLRGQDLVQGPRGRVRPEPGEGHEALGEDLREALAPRHPVRAHPGRGPHGARGVQGGPLGGPPAGLLQLHQGRGPLQQHAARRGRHHGHRRLRRRPPPGHADRLAAPGREPQAARDHPGGRREGGRQLSGHAVAAAPQGGPLRLGGHRAAVHVPVRRLRLGAPHARPPGLAPQGEALRGGGEPRLLRHALPRRGPGRSPLKARERGLGRRESRLPGRGRRAGLLGGQDRVLRRPRLAREGPDRHGGRRHLLAPGVQPRLRRLVGVERRALRGRPVPQQGGRVLGGGLRPRRGGAPGEVGLHGPPQREEARAGHPGPQGGGLGQPRQRAGLREDLRRHQPVRPPAAAGRAHLRLLEPRPAGPHLPRRRALARRGEGAGAVLCLPRERGRDQPGLPLQRLLHGERHGAPGVHVPHGRGPRGRGEAGRRVPRLFVRGPGHRAGLRVLAREPP
mmetsp:Transcript_37603/g.111584  ORF Transcript_37603/g.111584 Transcript_37603/m.111584 type:complete len:504 (-) Transcript_37603:674-2185(-)